MQCLGYRKGYLVRFFVLVKPCLRRQTTCLAVTLSSSVRYLLWVCRRHHSCNGWDSFCEFLLSSASSPHWSKGGEGSGGLCSTACLSCLAGLFLPPFIYLSLQEYTFVFKRKRDLLLCFQTGFSGHNGPNPLSKCDCIRIHSTGQEAIHGHCSGREQV